LHIWLINKRKSARRKGSAAPPIPRKLRPARFVLLIRAGEETEMAARAAPKGSLAPEAGESSVVTIPVSAGELIDKITILGLKTRRVRNAQKRLMAARELALLQRAAAPLRASDATGEIAALTLRLDEVNGALWDIEDFLRAMESAGDFGPSFVEAARKVYRLNDERARLKNAVSAAAGCSLTEVKEHPDYS
jgi:hypothetical protein